MTRRAVFVVGNSRSGTTMMGRILGRHPSIFTLGEIHFFEQLWSPADKDSGVSRGDAVRLMARLLAVQRGGYLGRSNPEGFRVEAEEAVIPRGGAYDAAGVFEDFLFREAARNGKTIPCEQTPRNVLYIGEVLELFPEARVVNLVRDPRDVLLSQKRKWKRRFLGAEGIPLGEALRSWVNYHPITISKLWNSSVAAADRFSGESRVLSLRFEDLVADPEDCVRRVCDLVGVAFDGDMLRVPQVGSSSGRDRPEEAGIDRERAGSWQKGGLAPTEVYLCQKVTGGLMERHGYVLAPVRPGSLRLALSLASLPLKLALALALNLKRMRNVRETIKRRLR